MNPEIWSRQIALNYQRKLALDAILRKDFIPLPWYVRWWNRIQYRWSEARERLGEIIAGRKFGDDW